MLVVTIIKLLTIKYFPLKAIINYKLIIRYCYDTAVTKIKC